MSKFGILLLLLIVRAFSFAVSQTTIRENWNLPQSNNFVMYGDLTQGSYTSGVSDNQANDGRSLHLGLKPNAKHGVGGAPAVETFAKFLYGTYEARVKTANCSAQPKAGVVTGIFTYFKNHTHFTDNNGNGLSDNSEIDFEWLCARPEVIHLSIWTDYEETDPPKLRVTYRSINIRTGAILMECYRESFGECQPLSSSENQPRQITPIPDYDSSRQYYTYRIILGANRVQLQMIHNGVTHTWWDYKGPAARIPKNSMHFMHNVWHTNNWYPIDDVNGTAIESPKFPVNVYVDYSTFTPLGK